LLFDAELLQSESEVVAMLAKDFHELGALLVHSFGIVID
jgi:hypothetical protein